MKTRKRTAMAVLLAALAFTACKPDPEPVHTHEWGAWKTTPATETENGTETRVCKTDQSHKETRFSGEYATGTAGLAYTLITTGTYANTYRVSRGTFDGAVVRIPAYYRPTADDDYIPVASINNFSSYDNHNTTLTTVTFAEENQLRTIGTRAFSYCTSLTSITIPTGVTSIGTEAFSGCTSLTSITIPTGVTSIGQYAFEDCTSLASITIPTSVTTFGDGVLYNTAWLNSQPDGLVYVSKILYQYKGTMPANTIINDIRSDTTIIASNAFYGYTNLISITIPASVTSIGFYAFSGCSTDLIITVANNNDNFVIQDEILYNKEKTTLLKAQGSISGSITIPEGVTSIDPYAFQNCTSITSITIPASVTSIGDWAFSGCTGLTSIEIPEGVLFISMATFQDCTNLTSVTLPASLRGFSGQAFYRCTSLTNITIPASVTIISTSAFSYCTSLTSITIPASVTTVSYAFTEWTAEQTINVPFANEDARPQGWRNDDWKGGNCNAVIKYWNGTTWE